VSSATGAAEQPARTVGRTPDVEDEPAAGEGASRASERGRAALGYLALAVVAFVPVLRSDPGKVVADTKQYLYLDPTRLLERAVYMWDPHIGMGTVTHQNIGYLFPMGPYFWVFDKLGSPDWLAQRIWLGSILFCAGAGVLYLLRTFGFRGPGVVVAALAYMCTPYTLDYSARISALLLPFAALPWLIGLTRKALRDGGWRYPAIFALVVQLVGGVNATALIFAGVGPVLWLLYAWLVDRSAGWRRVLTTTARIAVLTLLTSLWWMAGLQMQGTYGLDILKYTETVRAVATASFPNEILRGLGYWFFYGGDRLDPWIESASHYTQRPAVLVAGYGLVILSLLAAGLLRWRHRFFFVALLFVGMIIAVGPSPYADPTPLGSVFKRFATSSSAGLALRSTARAVPLVVLALAVLLGLAVNVAFRWLRGRGNAWLAAAVVGVVVLLVAVNLPALLDGSWYGENLERSENVPAYWTEAVHALDRDSHSTRVLEEPGADFAAYSWGNTVDPITPGLMDRPYLARELIPYGTAGTADLLNAFDRRFQEGVADPRGVADVLRRMGIGAVVLRNDIQYQRYDLVRPHELARLFAEIPGFRAPTGYGPPAPLSTGKPPAPGARSEDEISVGSPPNEPLLHPVVVYPVTDARPILRAESATRSVMLAGDGEGLVDAANAGLLAGSGVVRYSASYPKASDLRDAIAPDATLVLTDENRARSRIWGSVHENVGYTEQAGEKPLVDDPNDNQLPLFPGESAYAMTTTQQRGIKSIQASSYGNTITYTPEDRAVQALDGDVESAWRAAALGKAVGQFIRLQLDEPITTDHVNLVQPINGGRNRWITKVDVTFDGKDTQTFALDASSRSTVGQTLTFPMRSFSTLQLRVAATNDTRKYVFGGADAVGFAEIRLRDRNADHDVRADEVVQLPRDLLAAVGADAAAHPLVILMTREALRPVPPRTDPERAIVRTFELPAARTFALTGAGSVNPDASDTAIGNGLGVRSRVTADASESLPGCIRCRASAAADGDRSTAWNTPFVGVKGQWVQFKSPEPVTFERMQLQVVADGRHSVPTQIELEVDGSVRQLTVPPIRDRAVENATVTVPLRFPEISGRRIRVTITGVRTQLATRVAAGDTVAAPVGIAELGIAGLRAARAPAAVVNTCRSDLLTIDGRPVPVRLSGPSAGASRFGRLGVTACDPNDPERVPVVRLDAGSHDVRTSQGVDRGAQLDRIVLASAAGDGPLAVRGGQVVGLGTTAPPAPQVTVTRDGDTRMRVHVSGADDPFWLVLGQSQSPGWKATVAGGDSLGPSQMVDGYANGWFVSDPAHEFDVVLEWTPQRRVWTAIWVSLAAVLVCIAIACAGFVRARRRGRGDRTDPRDAEATLEWPVPARGAVAPPRGRARVLVPLLAGLVAALVIAPWAGLLVALLLLGMQWRPRLRVVLVLGPSLLLALAAAYIVYLQRHFRFPSLFEWPTLFPYARPLAWLAVVFLAADVVQETYGGGAAGGEPGAARSGRRREASLE
jgi:arabinofuranan 3-O-arabinosyltransferase